jgi:hypothetical protein
MAHGPHAIAATHKSDAGKRRKSNANSVLIRPTESDQPRIGDDEGGKGTVLTSRHGAKSTFKARGSQAVRFG